MKPHHKKISLAAASLILLGAALVYATLEWWVKSDDATPDQGPGTQAGQQSVAYSATGRVKGVSKDRVTVELAVAAPDGTISNQERVVKWYKTMDVVKRSGAADNSIQFQPIRLEDLKANMEVAVYSSTDISQSQEFFGYRIEVLK